MELVFKSETLRKKCETGSFFKKKDVHMNTKLIQRVRELEQAPTLSDIKRNKALKLHPLTGNRKYQLSIDIDGRKNVFRIIFETVPKETVCNDYLNDEKFELVTKIKILEVTDKTH